MRAVWLWVALSGWLVAIAGGQCWLLAYQYATDETPETWNDWPTTSLLCPMTQRFTLLLFVHPRCPCSRASLEELAWLHARSGGQLDSTILLWCPTAAPDDWLHGIRQNHAANLPQVDVLIDEGGRECDLFQITTSGTVLLFNTQGQLLFRGGITRGRGHAGDNPGRQAILNILNAKGGSCRQPTFGCPLCAQGGS